MFLINILIRESVQKYRIRRTEDLLSFNDRSLTIKDVSKFLSISTQMVHILIKDGRLKAFKIGSAIRILYSDMMEFIDLQKDDFEKTNIGFINKDDEIFVVDKLTYNIGEFILNDISFTVPRRKSLCILGSSGSGKTALLKSIAGLNDISSGRIFNGTKRIDELNLKDRNVGFVFENYALFKNLNAHDNIGFPLSVKRKKKDFINKEILKIADELNINEKYLEKHINELPEGIKQLVSIGREKIHAFDLLLMDEPLSKLDRNIKDSLCHLIKRLVTHLEKTTIISLNDPDLALVLGDYILVLNNGELIQLGEALQVYNEPASPLVMELTSRLGINVLDVTVKNNTVDAYSHKLSLQDGDYCMYFRPDNVSLSDNGISAEIKDVRFFDSNKSLYTCNTLDKKEIKLLLQNDIQEKFKFIPEKPAFFKKV